MVETQAAATSSATAQEGRWYVVHVYSGFENKVAQAIQEQAAEKGMSHLIQNVVVPAEEVTEVRRGAKMNVERKFFPGYILVQMNLTEESWHLVKNTPRVTGFLGGGQRGKPVPLSKAEAGRLTRQMQEGFTKTRSTLIYEIGDTVRVIEGPFESFTGTVEGVDEDRQKLKVSVSIFGRATPVELDYTQVEKI
jgi:transcriptional antiterminator NusG